MLGFILALIGSGSRWSKTAGTSMLDDWPVTGERVDTQFIPTWWEYLRNWTKCSSLTVPWETWINWRVGWERRCEDVLLFLRHLSVRLLRTKYIIPLVQLWFEVNIVSWNGNRILYPWSRSGPQNCWIGTEEKHAVMIDAGLGVHLQISVCFVIDADCPRRSGIQFASLISATSTFFC